MLAQTFDLEGVFEDHLDLGAGPFDRGATFLTTSALTAAGARTSLAKPHKIFEHRSFWADLLSSEGMAVNLFGDLAADVDRAGRAVHKWWPATPGRVTGALRLLARPPRPELLQ